MGQLLLPIFPQGTQMINMTLGVREHDGTVFYLHSGVPIFSHSSDDLNRFRFITSNLILQGRCTNQEIADNASVDGNLSKSQVKRSFGMSNSDICKFSKTMAAYELAVHDDQHMAPVGWCHSDCPVFVFYYHSFEVTFRKKLHNLCENIFANIHNCSNLYLNTKEQNSKRRQGFERLAYCA